MGDRMGGGASALDHPEAVAALKRVEALEEQVKALTAALEATAVTARATDSAPPEGDAGAAGAEAGASGKHKVFPGTVDVEDITDMSVDALWALLRDFSVTDPWSKAGLAMELVSGSNDVGATRKVVITVRTACRLRSRCCSPATRSHSSTTRCSLPVARGLSVPAATGRGGDGAVGAAAHQGGRCGEGGRDHRAVAPDGHRAQRAALHARRLAHHVGDEVHGGGGGGSRPGRVQGARTVRVRLRRAPPGPRRDGDAPVHPHYSLGVQKWGASWVNHKDPG